jgi:hydroxymethylpyrimidine pyrophosphatase-like HAD family hydrolase
MSGWIKIHRKFLDWEWFNKSEAVHLFMYLVLKANHKDGQWQGIDIKKGQFITSFGKISADTGISLQTIRTLLKKFEKSNEINIQTTNKYSVVTICKYECYQKETEVTNTQVTNKQQTTNNQLTTNKNDKNEKEVLFNDFWKIYDKQVDRKKCLEKFEKLKDEEIKLIFENLPNYILNTPDKQFRKNPATWINNKCWNDTEYSKPKTITYTPNIVHE